MRRDLQLFCRCNSRNDWKLWQFCFVLIDIKRNYSAMGRSICFNGFDINQNGFFELLRFLREIEDCGMVRYLQMGKTFEFFDQYQNGVFHKNQRKSFLFQNSCLKKVFPAFFQTNLLLVYKLRFVLKEVLLRFMVLPSSNNLPKTALKRKKNPEFLFYKNKILTQNHLNIQNISNSKEIS